MRTVVAGLLWRHGRLLICQRGAHGAFPGKWEFPGGKVESGEDAAAALRRELFEELGINAEIAEEVWRTVHQYPGHAAIELIFFSIREYQGEPENRAFQQMCWVTPQEIRRYDFLEADRPLIKQLISNSTT